MVGLNAGGFAGGHSAVVTFAPVLEKEGVRFAALGLTEMLNSGGAVLSCRLDKGVAASSRAGNGHSRKAARTVTGEWLLATQAGSGWASYRNFCVCPLITSLLRNIARWEYL